MEERNPTRRAFMKIVGLGAASLAVHQNAGGTGPMERKPNIIYILADDLGYGDLGCYGQKRVRTPNLDAMAAEGMRFTDHYAGSTVCAPSRCCLMTGYHTGHAWVRGNARRALRPEDLTVAELLKKAGYRTGLAGKWGLGEEGSAGVPNEKGFDHFFGYLNQCRAHNYYPEWLRRNRDRVPLRNEVIYKGEGDTRWKGSAATRRVDYSHDLITQEALEFIDQNREHPFFLYLAYTIPHANNEYHLVGGHGMEVPDYGEYADEDWPEPEKGFAAMVSRLDRDVGRILDRLRALGLEKDTLVLFSSDNGPHREGKNDPDFFKSSGPRKGIKRDLYEGGIRGPLICRWPGKIRPGTVSRHVSAFWDFLPTAAEVAGADRPDKIDGISFLPTLLGEPERQKEHEFLYWEFHERKTSTQAVRMGKWKGVRLGPDAPLALYDLTADPGEESNVSETHPEIVRKMMNILTEARTKSDYWKLKK